MRNKLDFLGDPLIVFLAVALFVAFLASQPPEIP
jgi:hypothetical protein